MTSKINNYNIYKFKSMKDTLTIKKQPEETFQDLKGVQLSL